jgi:hypothetical protein
LSITFPVARNAVKPPGLSEITVGVRNMGILRYRTHTLASRIFQIINLSVLLKVKKIMFPQEIFS